MRRKRVVVDEKSRVGGGARDGRKYVDLILSAIPSALLVVDPNLKVISANMSYYQTFDTSRERTEGRHISQLLQIEGLQARIEEVLRAGTSLSGLEFRYRTPSLGERFLEIAISRVQTQGEVLVLIDDVTERKRGEEEARRLTKELRESEVAVLNILEDMHEANMELKETKDYLESLLENANDIIYTTDREGKFKFINRKIEDLGYKPEELIGKPFLSILSEKHKGMRFAKSIEDGAKRSYEVEMKDSRGNIRNAIFSTSPLRDQDGSITGVLTIARDITERKRAEEELRRINQELESFVYTVSHDLRTPLISLQGFSSLLLKDYHDRLDEKGRDYLKRIQRNASQMGRLIQDLLELSRIGRVVHPLEDVDISELIDEILKGLELQLKERNIEVNVQTPLPIIHCDRTRVAQVFENLISNAIKFIGEAPAPRIEIGWTRKDGTHQFYVKDNGAGIAKEDQERIFGIFQRVGEVDADGTGAGLAIVKKIIASHNGHIWVESEKGKGSTFYFTLPE